jgi:hypothetical protein
MWLEAIMSSFNKRAVKEGEYLSKDKQSPSGDNTDILQWSKAKID